MTVLRSASGATPSEPATAELHTGPSDADPAVAGCRVKTVLSLCDRTGVMVQPWLDAGFRAIIVDTQHPAGEGVEGNLTRVGADVRTYLPPRLDYEAVFAFPPCTHLAKSGARWWKNKGLASLIEALELVEACRSWPSGRVRRT